MSTRVQSVFRDRPPYRDLLTRGRVHIAQIARALINSRDTRNHILRTYLFVICSQVMPFLSTADGDLIYLIDGSDRGLGRSIFSRAKYDDAVLQRAVNILENTRGPSAIRGQTVIDVGANVGTTALSAARRYGASRVLAFEPAANTFKLLQCNIIVNDLADTVTPIPVALSDTTGYGWLERSLNDSGDNRIRLQPAEHADLFHESSRSLDSVPLARLDDQLAGHHVDVADVGLLWIDAQGHEAHILAGAPRVVRSDIPLVLEYWPYGLRRSDGFDALRKVLFDNYPTAVDLRADLPREELFAATPELLGRLDQELTGPAFTDLLLLKDRPPARGTRSLDHATPGPSTTPSSQPLSGENDIP